MINLIIIYKNFSQYVDLLDLHDVKYFHLQRLVLLGTRGEEVVDMRGGWADPDLSLVW